MSLSARALRARALAATSAVMVMWGTTFAITKVAVAEIPPLSVAALRFVIGSAILIPLALARGGWRRLPQPVPLGLLVFMAASGIAFAHIAYSYALVYGSATQGALIYGLVPIAVVAAAVLLLGERLTPARTVGIALSVAGVALVVVAGRADAASPAPLLGALWMLATVAAWTAYTIAAKRLAHADQIVVIAVVTAIGTVLLVPFALVELTVSPLRPASLQAWLGVAYLGVVASALAFVLYSWVLSQLDATVVGAFLNLDPIVGVLTAALFLGEALSPGQVAGGLCALAGIVLTARAPAGGTDSAALIDGSSDTRR